MNITVHTKSGKTILVGLPNDATASAWVRIDGQEYKKPADIVVKRLKIADV